jgi:hypothetical protein
MFITEHTFTHTHTHTYIYICILHGLGFLYLYFIKYIGIINYHNKLYKFMVNFVLDMWSETGTILRQVTYCFV